MDVVAEELREGDILRTNIARLYQYYAERNKVHAGIVSPKNDPEHVLFKTDGKHVLLRDWKGVAAIDDEDYVEVLDVDTEEQLVFFIGYDCDEPVEFYLNFNDVRYGMQFQQDVK